MSDFSQEYRKRFDKKLIVGADLPPLEVISTGLFVLDNLVIKRGGLPRGRCVELAGRFGCGKTTLAAFIAAQFQRQGKVVAYFDAEKRSDMDWFAKLGVDVSTLLVPDTVGEDILTECKFLVAKGIDLIVIDSVNFVTPDIIMEREQEQLKMNEAQARAKLWKQFSHELSGGFKIEGSKEYFYLAKTGSIVLLLNHLYKQQDGYIEKDETLGGEGVKNASSVRIFMKKARDKTANDPDDSILVKCKCVKNSVAPVFGEGDIIIDMVKSEVRESWESLITYLKDKGKLDTRGAYYYIQVEGYPPESLTKPALIEKIKSDPVLKEKLF